MTDEEGDSSSVEEQPMYLTNFLKLFDGEARPKHVAIFTHACPDPDAIASIMAMEWLINKIAPQCEVTAFYDGVISHPQNVAMVNLLDPNLRPVVDYDPLNFDFKIVVDTVPVNAGVAKNKVDFDLVIDHHKEIPNGGFNGVFINVKAGSCCATIYHLIKKLKLKFHDDNDLDSKVATAIMVGISTDTENLMSEDCTNYEFEAWSDLFELRDGAALKKIVNFERPKFWIEAKASAVADAVVTDGLGIVGLGNIPGRHRDMIADMADNMVSWEDVNTAVAFAIVDGDRIEGCVRSRNASVMVPQLCKELAGKHGLGGGKLGKGAYRYSLGGTAFDDEDDEETRNETWKLLNTKENKRILRVVRK